jgi:hypothetical protein
MAKSIGLKGFVLVFLSSATFVALWQVVDAPVAPGRPLEGVVTQAFYVPARYSDGRTRIVVQVDSGTFLTFERFGQTFLRPGMPVTVLRRQRRLSGIYCYELLQ